ncbi:MAG: hypothetical protein J6P43_07520, partial [Succinivibrionaceae bacterium]|nr:hypothetical protein [Succinivibrionaceae bacterium]
FCFAASANVMPTKNATEVSVGDKWDKILDEYERRFGGLPADGGFSVEAAKECLETGRDFYDRFPKDVNP